MNLDTGPRPKTIITMGGKDFDTSFIPCGVSIPLLSAYEQWINNSVKDESELETNSKLAMENLYTQIDILAIFTSFHDPACNRDWIMRSIDLGDLIKHIISLVNIIRAEIEIITAKKKDAEAMVKNSVGNE